MAVSGMTVSCRWMSNTDKTLDKAEAYIKEAPDSAFMLLDSLAAGELFSGRDKARYALLYSAASEISGLKPVSDSLIKVAFDYYNAYGSDKEKTKVYYTLGRLYENAGNENAAMFCYVTASHYLPFSEDEDLKALLFTAKARLYEYAFDYRNAKDNYILAGKEYMVIKDMKGYTESFIRAAKCNIELGDKTAASECLEKLRPHWNELDDVDKVRFFRQASRLDEKLSIAEVREAVREEFGITGSLKSINLLSVSDIYLQSGYADSALTYLTRYSQMNPEYKNNPFFFLHLSNVYDSMGLYRSAYSAYKKHVVLKDSLYMDKIQENVQFVEERYEEHEKLYEMRLARTVLIILLAVISLTGTFTIIRFRRKFWTQKKKVAHLKELYRTVKAERDALSDMVKHSISIDESTRKVLENRVFILDEIVTQRLMDKSGYTPEKASEMIEAIARDKDAYMNTLGLMFSIRHPEFTAYLKNHLLSTWEIGYCSLYCMGYKGKEIGNILSSSRYYKINSSIRRKLGLSPTETNIDIYVRKIMFEIENQAARACSVS